MPLSLRAASDPINPSFESCILVTSKHPKGDSSCVKGLPKTSQVVALNLYPSYCFLKGQLTLISSGEDQRQQQCSGGNRNPALLGSSQEGGTVGDPSINTIPNSPRWRHSSTAQLLPLIYPQQERTFRGLRGGKNNDNSSSPGLFLLRLSQNVLKTCADTED